MCCKIAKKRKSNIWAKNQTIYIFDNQRDILEIIRSFYK